MSRTKELLEPSTEEENFYQFLRDQSEEEELEYLQSKYGYVDAENSEEEDLRLTLKHCI